MGNENLVEVLCAIKFNPIHNEWDSTFFGKYHDIIIKSGFVDKKEHRDRNVEFQIPQNQQPATVKTDENIRMVFSNPITKAAITLQPYYISFHKLAPYETWEKLISEIVKPRLDEYKSMGLGKEVLEVQCLYLNRYDIGKNENISKYFNFLPLIQDTAESQLFFQGKYDVDQANSIQLKLQTAPSNNQPRHVFFECTSFARIQSTTNDVWKLAEIAHDNANKAYQSIIKN